MAEQSNIEWTDATVNFWWGCTKVGPGCDNCYAEAWDARFGEPHWGQGVPRRKIKGAVKLLHRLDNQYADWATVWHVTAGNRAAMGQPPPDWRSRRRVFIQSMSDLFDNEVPIDWFDEAWRTIEACNRLHIQILTKRISMVEKRLEAIGRSTWPQHAGLMITVVNQQEADRDIPRLLDLKSRFGIPWVGLSMEPLLGPVDLQDIWPTRKPPRGWSWNALRGWKLHYSNHRPLDSPRLDWVIAGGESGPCARPTHPDWFRSLRDQCGAAGVPFFFKQNGDWVSVSEVEGAGPHHTFPDGATVRRIGKKAAGRTLDGVIHNAMPASMT